MNGGPEPQAECGMSDHVIVCGLQGVGLRTVEQFHLSGTQVVVVDEDADARFAHILEDWGGAPHPAKRLPGRRPPRGRVGSGRGRGVR